LLDKNITAITAAAVSVLSTGASCMQTKNGLKTAKWQCRLMEMWAVVPKKSKPGIFYVVYKCVFHITAIKLTLSNIKIWNLSQS